MRTLLIQGNFLSIRTKLLTPHLKFFKWQFLFTEICSLHYILVTNESWIFLKIYQLIIQRLAENQILAESWDFLGLVRRLKSLTTLRATFRLARPNASARTHMPDERAHLSVHTGFGVRERARERTRLHL